MCLKVQCMKDKVNFKEVKASKELRNCEVARLGGVTFLSGQERCDIPSLNIGIERAAQDYIAFIHTCTVCVWYTAIEHDAKEQCRQ